MEGTILQVGLYARVSSERQADEQTIDSQLDALRERIRADGQTVDDVLCFVDDGYSGDTLLRPDLERLREIAWAGGLARLYVTCPDRLARKYAYQVLLLEELAQQHVEVVFLNHVAHGDSPEQELLLQMQGMFAEYERAKILERSRRGRRHAARHGKVSVLGHAPFGYRYIAKRDGDGTARYDVVLDEARQVRELFTWVGVEGLSLGDVVRRLAEQGVPTPTGKPRWDRATIRGLLTNPAYTGTARYGKTRLFPRETGISRSVRGRPVVPRRPKVARPTLPEEQEPIRVPALVSEELFAAVAAQLEENRRRYRMQKQGSPFLLSGLLVCHCCGSAYCGRRQHRAESTDYVYYRCLGTDKYRHGGETLCHNKALSGAPLETAVWSDVCALLEDPARLRSELQRRLDHEPANDFDARQRQEMIIKLKRRVSRLIDAYEQGWLEKDEFEPRLRRAKAQLACEEEVLLQQQSEEASVAELRLVVAEFDRFAAQIRAGLSEADAATKRKLLRVLVKRIEVDAEEIRIVYKVQTHPFVLSPGSASGRGVLQDCLKYHNIAQGK